jgi:hypothetical protein
MTEVAKKQGSIDENWAKEIDNEVNQLRDAFYKYRDESS